MKKILAYFTMSMLLFSATGCSTDNGTTTENTTTQSTQQTTQSTNTESSQRDETAPLLQSQPPQEGEEIAIIQTNKGEIRMRFCPEQAPKAVENFKKAAELSKKYYGESRDYALSLQNLGYAYKDMGDKEKALEAFNLALPVIEKVYGKESKNYERIAKECE